MSEETKTEFINKPTNRGFERIEFRDHYGVDCSIQASSLATEECIWFGCSKLELKGFRPGSGWLDIDADSLGFKYLQGNTRMHLTREQVGEIIPFLQTFYLDGKIEYRDDDVTEIKEIIGNSLSAAQEITQLRAELAAERERREAAEMVTEKCCYDAHSPKEACSNNSGLLDCPICGAFNAFVISQADPSDGFCRVEGKVHTVRVLLCECAVRAPGKNVCLRCMRPYHKDGSSVGGRYA